MCQYIKKFTFCILTLTINLTLGQTNNDSACQSDDSPARHQLEEFKNRYRVPVGPLTSSTGRQMERDTANDVHDTNLIFHDRFMESLTSLVREPILPRVIHAKAAGAFGYFEVTHDVSDIMNIDAFNQTGKRTPVSARFSTTALEGGSADTVRDNRGFAVKFKTTEGILDLLSLSTPVFVVKDPIKYPSFVHALKRNSQTHLQDKTMFWDFVNQNPETVSFFLHLFSDIGIPSSITKMSAFALMTFTFCNHKKETFFGRFRWVPDAGIESLSSADAVRLAGENPDYFIQDLYDRISSKNYPSWTLYIQVLSENDVKNASVNVFDPTISLDYMNYPLRPIGKMYLNENPEDYVRDVEQLAFCARNLVPGITGVDKLFEARCMVYLDAHNQRLGVNHKRIPANSPLFKTHTYYRDGVEPAIERGNNGPNYYPNSFFGPEPVAVAKCPDISPDIKVRAVLDPGPTNLGQASDYFDGLKEEEKVNLVNNIIDSLSKAEEFIQNRTVDLFTEINKDLGSKVAASLQSKKQVQCVG